MSLEKRRLPWQQPIQSKEKEIYVYSYKELIAAISSFTVSSRQSGRRLGRCIKIGAPFPIEKTVIIPEGSDGLIIDGINTPFLKGSNLTGFMFNILSNNVEMRNVATIQDEADRLGTVKFLTGSCNKFSLHNSEIQAECAIDGAFTDISVYENKFYKIVAGMLEIDDGDGPANYYPDGTSMFIIHNESGGGYYNHNFFERPVIAGTYDASMAITYGVDVDIKLDSLNDIVTFNQLTAVTFVIPSSSSLFLFNNHNFGTQTSGNPLKANGTGSEPTFQP
jgi:hypothetical protein